MKMSVLPLPGDKYALIVSEVPPEIEVELNESLRPLLEIQSGPEWIHTTDQVVTTQDTVEAPGTIVAESRWPDITYFVEFLATRDDEWSLYATSKELPDALEIHDAAVRRGDVYKVRVREVRVGD